MQRITVKEIKGPLGQGEKKLYAVVDEAGAEFTTFDTKIKDITPGSVLDIEPVIKGKFVNIKEYKVISEGTPKPASPASTNGNDMSKEDWEKKQRIERASFEAQTAVKVILQHTDQGAPLYQKALAWCEAKIDANLGAIIKVTKAKPKADNGWDKLESEVQTGNGKGIDPKAPFPSVGKLLDWCREQGISRPDVLKIVGCDEQGISKVNIPDAFELVKQEIDKRRPK